MGPVPCSTVIVFTFRFCSALPCLPTTPPGRTEILIGNLPPLPRTESGKDIWKHVRPSAAHKESQESYATPIPYKGKNGLELLTLGGNCITGHTIADGSEIWRCGGLNAKDGDWMRIVPSPVAGDGMIFACAPKREPIFAIKDGGKGDITSTGVAWIFKVVPKRLCDAAFL